MFKKKKKKRNSCDAFSGIVFAINEHEAYEKAMQAIKPKKKFNIDNYPGKYVMHCENKDELFKFYDYLHSVGRKLSTGRDYVELKATRDAAGRPIKYIFFNEGLHASYMDKAYASKYTVLNFKDFDWSDSNMERKTKFKVGDKVKIVKIRGDHMGKVRCLGTTCTISSINPNQMWSYRKLETHYGVRDTSGDLYVWFEDEIELVEEKPFTKADLKPGMVVELCDGDRYLFVNDKFANAHEWSDSKHYNNDLTHSVYDNLHIVKVYTSTGHTLGTMLNNSSLTLVWERKDDVKEMTVAEIEEKLGFKVKVIADKE